MKTTNQLTFTTYEALLMVRSPTFVTLSAIAVPKVADYAVVKVLQPLKRRAHPVKTKQEP